MGKEHTGKRGFTPIHPITLSDSEEEEGEGEAKNVTETYDTLSVQSQYADSSSHHGFQRKRRLDDVHVEETSRNPSTQEGFIPFRLFTSQNDKSDGSTASQCCNTLRQMLGLDRSKDLAVHDGEGPIQWIVVCNYLIDFDFLLDEVPELLTVSQTVVFYGEAYNSSPEQWRHAVNGLGADRLPSCSVDFVKLVPSDPPKSITNPLSFQMMFGVHHTKMFLVGYKSFIRVIIHTANLIHQDIHLKTQGAYIQDFPMKARFLGTIEDKVIDPIDLLLEASSFENSLVEYLQSYHYTKRFIRSSCSKDQDLVTMIRRYDYSKAYAVLIPSVPGWHKVDELSFGKLKLKATVLQYAPCVIDAVGPVICQFSSMGSLTKAWFCDFISCMRGDSLSSPSAWKDSLQDHVKIIWPTVEEVRTSVEGYQGGSSLPGSQKNVSKDFLVPLYHRWSSRLDPLKKGKNIPHIKTYLRLNSEDKSVIDYIILTSHNLSKAAWGEVQQTKYGRKFVIRHWELGVFFSSKVLDESGFFTHESTLAKPSTSTSSSCETAATPHASLTSLTSLTGKIGTNNYCIPLPYAVSSNRYKPCEEPWSWDRVCSVPDRFGRRHG